MLNLNKPKRIAVFCGAKPGAGTEYLDQAVAFGRFLAEQEIGLVYGGSDVGLMGAIATAMLELDADVIGVMPTDMNISEELYQGLPNLVEVADLQERKRVMADLADAFVALPGGFGTLDEIFEMLALSQMGEQRKPCAFLDVAGFYSPLLAFLRHASAQGFVHQDYLDMIICTDQPNDLLNQISTFVHPHLR